MASNSCTRCGASNVEDSRFCSSCGSQLSSLSQLQTIQEDSGPPAGSRIGQRLGHYRLVELLGRGGFGEVYKAEDSRLERLVALKTLPEDVAADPQRLERFHREAKAIAALSHPNIVTVHAIEESDGVHFLTMELLEGGTLDRKIPDDGLPLDRFLALAVPLANALAAAHERGITHRDLKPANIMLGNDGAPRILDFGLARVSRKVAGDGLTRTVSDDLTREGTILGTIGYMAPEQIQGKTADSRSDVFSFGMILYEMATGRRAFSGDSSADLISAIMRDQPSPVSERRGDYPVEVSELIRRCLEKDPQLRFRTAAEAAARLREAASKATVGRIGLRSAPRWIAAAAVVALIGAATSWLLLRGWRSAAPEPGPDLKRIVVMPLENLGPPEEAYFAAGLTEEITSRLAVVAGLGVVSRTTAVKYLGSGKSVREIGDELDVDYVLAGSVRWQKNAQGTGRVRVTSQLIQVADDRHLWADNYDRQIEDIFDVQSDIAQQVTDQLNVTLLEPEREAIATRPTENMAAYQAYLRGVDFQQNPDREQYEPMAIEMFETAVELDPGFALAHARLSKAISRRYASGLDRSPERKRRARAELDRALELEPDLPEAHMALGYYHYWVNLEYERALEAFEVARRGLPNDTEVLSGMSYAVRRSGDLAASIDYMDRALRLNPRDSYPFLEQGLSFMMLRDYEEADDLFRKSIAVEPNQSFGYACVAWNEWLWRGRLARGREQLIQAPRSASPGVSWVWFWQDVYEGDYQAAIDHIASPSVESAETWSYAHPNPLLRALAHRFAGEPELAQRFFDEARNELEERLGEGTEDPTGQGRLHGALGMAYAGLARKADAIREGRLAVELHPYSKDLLAAARLEELALIYTMTGEPDLALDRIEFLLSNPNTFSARLLTIDPRWAPLRDHPRFVEMLSRYGDL